MIASSVRNAVYIVVVLASATMAIPAEKKPIFPPPKVPAKFHEFQVVAVRNPTISPLDVEQRTRWRIERELASWEEPKFPVGKNGLTIELKFLRFEEPQAPFPPRRRATLIPSPKGQGSIPLPPEAEPVPIPPLGQAHIQLTFRSADGTLLSQFDFVDSVPERRKRDEESAFTARTGRIAANYARYYFLEANPK